MTKYLPSVADVIRSMKRGNPLSTALVRTAMTRRFETFSAVGSVGSRELSPQTWNRVMATQGDLIELVPGSAGIGRGTYQLTARGQSIVLDRSGQEQPEGWTPPPAKKRQWKHPRVYLAPGLNRVFVVEDEVDYDVMPGLWDPVSQEPLIQIPCPDMSVTTVAQWLKDKKLSDPKAHYQTFAEVVAEATEPRWVEVKLTREWEGWFTHYPGDAVCTVAVKQGDHWYVDDAPSMRLDDVLEELWEDVVTGRPRDARFDADSKEKIAANRRLALARRRGYRGVPNKRTLWYFKIKIEFSPREGSEWRVLELSADKGIHLGGLQVDLPANN